MLKDTGDPASDTVLSRTQLCKVLHRLKVSDPDLFLTQHFGNGEVTKELLREWVFGEQG